MDKSISSDLIRGHIDTIILHSLFSGDKHAQQISDYVAKKSENNYEINQATLYSSLKRLETSKYVKAYWHDTDGGRRRFFTVTELGKSVAENNLSDWSYSKSVIDKLMDLEPVKTVRSEIILVPTTTSSDNSKEKNENSSFPANNNSYTDNSKLQENSYEKTTNLDISVVEKEQSSVNQPKTTFADVKVETIQEINYKNILSGLIKTSNIVKEIKSEQLEPLKRSDEKTVIESTQSEISEKKKLSETISSESLSSKIYNIGNINYGDLELKAEKNGYKLLVSSKESKITSGLFANKIRLFSSLTIFLLGLIEILVFTLATKSFLSVPIWALMLSIIFFATFPIVCSIIYKKNPIKITQKSAKESLLTSLIVIFNLIILCIAIPLLCNMDFSNQKNVALFLITPLLITFDVFAYYITAYFCSKSNKFILKENKK